MIAKAEKRLSYCYNCTPLFFVFEVRRVLWFLRLPNVTIVKFDTKTKSFEEGVPNLQTCWVLKYCITLWSQN